MTSVPLRSARCGAARGPGTALPKLALSGTFSKRELPRIAVLIRSARSRAVCAPPSCRRASLRHRANSEPVEVNGRPALLIRLDGELDGIMAFRIENGLVSGIYYVRNPEKLSRLGQATAVSR